MKERITDNARNRRVIPYMAYVPREKPKGLYALYIHYCYLLGALPKERPNNREAYAVIKEDVKRARMYSEEAKLLGKYNINTAEELSLFTEGLSNKFKELAYKRAKLRNKLRRIKFSGTITQTMVQSPSRGAKQNPLSKEGGFLFYIEIYSVLWYNSGKKDGGGIIKKFCFTVDDNIRFLKEITENQYQSIFDHPYLAMYRRLHKEFDLKIQLNLFFRMENFDLSQMSDAYYEEWKENSDWLKLSFHSDFENVRPYEHSGYDVVYGDCKRVHEQIIRFASPKALANTTTIHYCLLTEDGLTAMRDNGVVGLLGLFGDKEKKCTSYGIEESKAEKIRKGCVSWAKENNVTLITAEHMAIINDKRSKEKSKK